MGWKIIELTKEEKEKGSSFPLDWRNLRFKDLRIEMVNLETGEVIIPKHYGFPKGAGDWVMGV